MVLDILVSHSPRGSTRVSTFLRALEAIHGLLYWTMDGS